MAKIMIGELKETFYEASGTLSDIVRQISIVGVGVVWIFVKVVDESIIIDSKLIWSLGCFLIALFVDMLQYLYKSIVFYCKFRCAEEKYPDNEEKVEDNTTLLKPYTNIPTWICWGTKILFSIIGYIILLGYLLEYIKIE